jgi:hypothetical protein
VRLAGKQAESDMDYVLVGRRAALSLEFERLVADLLTGFTALAARRQAETESVKPRQ